MEKFQKHVSSFEKTTAIVLFVFLFLTIVTQLFFHGNVMLLMAILLVSEVVFCGLVFLPEVYEFREDSLAILRPKLGRDVEIPYTDILDFDTVGSFRRTKKDLDSVEVILTFKVEGKKKNRTISCHPKNVLGFVKRVQDKCPNLIE